MAIRLNPSFYKHLHVIDTVADYFLICPSRVPVMYVSLKGQSTLLSFFLIFKYLKSFEKSGIAMAFTRHNEL
jgi:hypothetical protein